MFEFSINFYNELLHVNELHTTEANNISDAIDQITDEFPYLIDDYDYEVCNIVIVVNGESQIEKATLKLLQMRIYTELQTYLNTNDSESADYILSVKIGSLLSNVVHMFIK